MEISIDIDTEGKSGAETIADGAGVLAARLLRDIADRAEVGGIVSGPIHLPGTDKRIGRYSYTISRERVEPEPDDRITIEAQIREEEIARGE